MNLLKTLLLTIFVTIIFNTSAQELDSRYNSDIIQLMTSKDETDQYIFSNIVDRTFSLDLDSAEFYDMINFQAKCAISVKNSFLSDEGNSSEEDGGIYMIVYINALREGTGTIYTDYDTSNPTFNRHYDWCIVLSSYMLGSGIIKSRIYKRDSLRSNMDQLGNYEVH